MKALLCMMMAACAVGAIEQPAATPDLPAAAAAQAPVQQALRALRYVSDTTPRPAARYYIYLQSAKWCSPCRAEMPRIVQAYSAMQAAGVEPVLVSHDATAEAALDYITTYKVPFAGTHMSDPGLEKLPGFVLAKSIPHITIVNADGHVVFSGHGAAAQHWQDILAEYEARLEQGEKAPRLSPADVEL